VQGWVGFDARPAPLIFSCEIIERVEATHELHHSQNSTFVMKDDSALASAPAVLPAHDNHDWKLRY
jgi:hypothetical protein